MLYILGKAMVVRVKKILTKLVGHYSVRLRLKYILKQFTYQTP